MSTKRQNTPKAIYNSAIAALREIEAGNEKPLFVGIFGELYKAEAPKGVYDLNVNCIAPGKYFLDGAGRKLELTKILVYDLLQGVKACLEQKCFNLWQSFSEGMELEALKDIAFKLSLYAEVRALIKMAMEIADYGKKLER